MFENDFWDELSSFDAEVQEGVSFDSEMIENECCGDDEPRIPLLPFDDSELNLNPFNEDCNIDPFSSLPKNMK